MTQSGTNNVGDIDQWGGNGEATILQSNTGNDAYINQTAPAEYGIASIEQSGEGNVADILQTGLGTGVDPNTATILQSSDFNAASISQHGGAGNNASITQM